VPLTMTAAERAAVSKTSTRPDRKTLRVRGNPDTIETLGALAGSAYTTGTSSASCQRRTKIAHLGVRTFSWTVYATSPRLARYSTGLKPPSESLIRFSLYHRMYSATSLMNCFTVVFRQFRL
jgi:hypothetical protein